MASKTGRKPVVVKGQVADYITRDEFRRRFEANFFDPAFAGRARRDQAARGDRLGRLQDGRKAPITQKAGKGFADPDYDLSVEWMATRDRLLRIEAHGQSAKAKSRVLVICGSPRNDGTCPARCRRPFDWRSSRREALERGNRSRFPRPEPAHLRIRPQDPSVQGLRVDRDAALPLAVQLLPEPCARTRSTTGWPRSTSAGPRRTASSSSRRCTGTSSERAQADDRSPGLRRRRQSRPDATRTARTRRKRRRSS